jgi:hypothetical protein
MVAVTADTHLEPFFLNVLLYLVQGPRTMFENLGLEVPPIEKSHRDLNQASAVATELPRVRRPLDSGTPPS